MTREDKLSQPQAVAVIEENTVIVETLPTPYRYYVVPLVTGFAGISISTTVGTAVGSESIVWNIVGVVGGVFAGMIAALMLQDWKQDKMKDAIAEGKREVSNDMVVKKGKISRMDIEEEGGIHRKTLHVVTPRYDFELEGDADEVDRVYAALT